MLKMVIDRYEDHSYSSSLLLYEFSLKKSQTPNAAMAPVNIIVFQEWWNHNIIFTNIRNVFRRIPKKVQYVIIDSNFVNGTNNTFSLISP